MFNLWSTQVLCVICFQFRNSKTANSSKFQFLTLFLTTELFGIKFLLNLFTINSKFLIKKRIQNNRLRKFGVLGMTSSGGGQR